MSASGKMQFFVVTRDPNSTFDLQKVDLENRLQDKLSQEFLDQSNEFVGSGVRAVPFHATYTPSADTISTIDPFDIPPLFVSGMNKPQQFQKIKMPFTPKGPIVKAIVGIDNGSTSGTAAYYFQHFDRSHILQTANTVFYRSGMFYSMVDPGVRISDRLTAVITGTELRFRSYARTNQFLDLSAHFREASDKDIENILNHSKVVKKDPANVINVCKPMMRKKFAAILFTKVLDNVEATPQKIQGGMKRFFGVKIDIKIQKPSGNAQIVFPVDPIELAHLLEYLTDSVYVSDLTGEFRSSNSHRPLSS